MSRVFIIPDVHLKPWMFDKATELIGKGNYDEVVLLGDLVDDWNHEKDLDLYKETFDRLFEFLEIHPETMYCFGNHDVSYLFGTIQSGYSSYARDIVVEGVNKIIKTLPKENSAYIHRIDNVLFSHAGLTERFVKRCFGGGSRMEIDNMIDMINRLPKDIIWRDDSPIWARPQYRTMRMYPMNMMQVVGHTPVESPLIENGGKILTIDNFSTYRDGEPIGNQKFVWVDTVTEEWGLIDDE